MRFCLIAILWVSACTTLPQRGVAADLNKRGAVEIAVKSNATAIINDIADGGGPALTLAMDRAGVPADDRPARITQLQGDIGLYAQSPAALVTTLLLYGR